MKPEEIPLVFTSSSVIHLYFIEHISVILVAVYTASSENFPLVGHLSPFKSFFRFGSSSRKHLPVKKQHSIAYILKILTGFIQ